MKYETDPLQGAELLVRETRPDAKKRVTLGKALDAYPPDVQFAVYRNEQGQLVLDPLITVPAREAWLFANREALQAVLRGLGEAGRGETEALGSFADFADTE